MENIPKKTLPFGVYITKPHLGWAVAAFTAVFVATAIDKYIVVVLQNLTNAIAVDRVDFNQVWFWGIAFPVVNFLSSCVWRISGFTGMRWFAGMRATGYEVLYSYLSLHSKDYFNSRFAGALANKISNAVEGADDLGEKILWRFSQLILGILIYAVITGLNSWILGVIIFVWSAIFLVANVWFASLIRPSSYVAAEMMSTLKGRIVDSLSNISIVQEQSYVKGEREYIKKYIHDERDAALKSWFYSEWVLVANGFLIFAFVLLMLISSIYLLSAGLINIGVIVMVVAVVGDLTSQLFFIGQEIRDSARLDGQVKEGLDEILTEHVIKDSPDATSFKVKDGNISFESVRFDYDNTKVFDNFSLEIPAGQKIGIVGRSGAGKTTFVSLLLRHFDVNDGAIKIDDKDIRNIKLGSLRKAMAFVPQDTSLFHRTILENIRYSRQKATDKQVVQAAKLAQADGFISALPNGYETMVGERGIKLSGGQRQRIAIARAFLKDAPILVLDEATSSLDSESEQAIQESLADLMKGRTVIAIAHRLSTLKKMDRIVLIEEGRIVEDGSPEALLKKKHGVFKALWEHQVKGFIVDG